MATAGAGHRGRALADRRHGQLGTCGALARDISPALGAARDSLRGRPAPALRPRLPRPLAGPRGRLPGRAPGAGACGACAAEPELAAAGRATVVPPTNDPARGLLPVERARRRPPCL